MGLWIHNLSEETKEYQGRAIEADAFFEIPENLKIEFQQDGTLLQDLLTGDAVMSNDGATDYAGSPSQQIDFLKNIDPTPRDLQGRPIFKPAATSIVDGAYQLHALEFTTSKLNSVYNKDENGNDLGFGTIKLYKQDGTEITAVEDESLCVKTVIDWMTTHPLEIIGGELFHAVPPATDCRMWIIAAPNILNIKFGQGGINLKHVGSGTSVKADGRATKYLPTAPAGINKMRLVFKHDAGLVYNAMMLFELFKA